VQRYDGRVFRGKKISGEVARELQEAQLP